MRTLVIRAFWILAVFVTLTSFVAETPTISIDFVHQKLLINQAEITENSSIEDIIKLVGNFDREQKIGAFNYYFFDQIGLVVAVKPESKRVKEVSVFPKIVDDKKAPKTAFSGKIILEGKALSSSPALTEVKALLPADSFKELKGFALLAQKAEVNLAFLLADDVNVETIAIGLD